MLVHNKIGLPFYGGNAILGGNYDFARKVLRGSPNKSAD
jgi:hypothetical protein